MILTHGANSLSRSALRIWELDIPNLVISDHTDPNGIVYEFIGTTSGITKIDNDEHLKLNASGGAFDFRIKNLSNLGNLKKIEILVSDIYIDYYYIYVGACGLYLRKSFDYSSFGVWACTNAVDAPLTFYAGNYRETYNDIGNFKWFGYDSISLTSPYKITVEIEDEEVRLLFNDTLIATKPNDFADPYSPYFNKDVRFTSGEYGGDSNVVVQSVKIWYE